MSAAKPTEDSQFPAGNLQLVFYPLQVQVMMPGAVTPLSQVLAD